MLLYDLSAEILDIDRFWFYIGSKSGLAIPVSRCVPHDLSARFGICGRRVEEIRILPEKD